MKSLARVAIAGIATVAVLFVVFLLLQRPPGGTLSTGIVFASGEATDVEAVLVSNRYGSYSFYFDHSEQGYVIDDIPAYIADLDAFVDFLSNCASLSAIRHIPLGDAVAQDWGLDRPSAEVEIILFSGERFNLLIGDIERISGNYYASVDGFAGIYILPKATGEQFLRPKTHMISRLVTPPLAVSSPLSAILDVVFTGGGLEYPVAIHAAGSTAENALDALSFGGATHIVRGAAIYQLDQTYGVGILGSLFGLTALDIAGYNLTSAEIAAYGFDRPYMTVDYLMQNGVNAEVRRMRLHIAQTVAQSGDGSFYAMLEGIDAVYIIGREAFIDIQYDKLLLRWFLTPFIMDLSSVTITAQETSYRFELDNADPRNPVITYNGQVLDTELFRSFFRLITSAAHDGDYLGPHAPPLPGQDVELTITYEYRNTEKGPDSLALYPGGVRRHNVYVNGAGEFAIKDLFAQRVLEGCANLIAGRVIEEEW